MSRYPDCTHPTGGCAICSLSSYGRDCRNVPINHIAYLRACSDLTQKEVSGRAGMHINQVKKLESGEILPANLTLKNALALASALGVRPEDLLYEV